MADNNKADRSGNILVEFDYDNIIVVDPNKTIDFQGNVSERLVDHENLVMFANLEAYVLPRTRMAVGQSPEETRFQTVSVAKINFLRGQDKETGNYLTSGYYDELTGKGTTEGKGQNQIIESTQTNGKTNPKYVERKMNEDAVDNGLLGITSINVRVNTSFVPQISIELEDVQGRALFQLGDMSPYAAFFNLPYPPFYLTLKGYYGQAIKYQLNLTKFNARFNTFSGNYQVSLEFVGYKFNILNEISIGHLFAAPHMYSKRFEISNASQQQEVSVASKANASVNGVPVEASNSKTNTSTEVISEKGYQKIVEVYSEYKSKGLISENFPELTLAQLIAKLEQFEQTVLSTFTKADVDPLTNCRNYKNTLSSYYQRIIGSPNSWFNRYLNPKPFITTDKEKIYAFKDNLGIEQRIAALTKLEGDVNQFNGVLEKNETLGKGKKEAIENPITPQSFTANTQLSQIDILATINEQSSQNFKSGDFNNENYIKLKTKFFKDYENTFKPVAKISDENVISVLPNTFFIFDGTEKGRFIPSIANMEAQTNQKLGKFESEISEVLASKIEDSTTGLGFKPTVRNFTAVIMANTEGFIRLLDDVHVNAWSERDNPVRKKAILDNIYSAPNPDGKENVQGSLYDSYSKIPVYPWPHYFQETVEDKKGRFQLKYIGDPSVVDKTKGYDTKSWPEVEFVEEYLKGLTQKFNPPDAQPPNNNQGKTNILNINAIEFPQTSIAYSNKEQNKFFYEIFERQLLTAKYTGLNRLKNGERQKIIEIVSDNESENIITSLGISNPYLTSNLKNYSEQMKDYPKFLEEISNSGTGTNYQAYIRDFFVTPYIESLTNQTLRKSFDILKLSKLGDEPLNGLNVPELLETISSDNTNITNITDTYPFTDETWANKNLESSNKFNGNLIFSTKNVLKIYPQRNVISNFTNVFDTENSRPVTNFDYTTPKDLNRKTSQDATVYYNERLTNKITAPTESVYYFNTPNNQLVYEKVGSMMNTPFFLNALLESADKLRPSNKSSYPFVTPAYLFLNSLPLISLRELYKSNNPQDKSGTNYMFATLKKFGAIHKLPQAWILKIGSIWHRYKTHVLSGKDILDSVWKDIDYVKNYDPITLNPQKKYTFKLNKDATTDTVIQMENEYDNNISIEYGFYPKIINDFNLIFNGFDLYKKYTDEEIQASVDNGLLVYNQSPSNINLVIEGDKKLSYKTWSVILPSEMQRITDGECKPPADISRIGLIIPSYGTIHNETKDFLINSTGLIPFVLPNYKIYKNASVYNGTARMFWSIPNYGYFNTGQLKKPPYNCYLNKIENTETNKPFKILNNFDYSTIEELFSIFSKSVLDEFETKFLSFCKPATNIKQTETTIEYGKVPWDINQIYENFQVFFKELMILGEKEVGVDTEIYFNKSTSDQNLNIYKLIDGFLTYDVLFKFGNPSGYDRRIFDSLLSSGGAPIITDPIPFEQYQVGSLPSKNGTTTLQQSRFNYPEEWANLELEVGFSTIQDLKYSDNGCYITDFFIDNNIRFTVDNIKLLSFLIKIYATQKLANPQLNKAKFNSLIRDYLNDCDTIQNLTLQRILSILRQKLPNANELPEKTIQSIIDGQQSKVEDYEMFKSLNDKWIAGNDYKNKTLFEDILFLDRASRNIGDTIYLDIFSLKDLLNSKSMNMTTSVYLLLAGLLRQNNFAIMNLPAYINFYNVQNVDGLDIAKPEGSLDFANNLWGTFLNVDYRNASSKMLCFFTGRPSAYPQSESKFFRFNSDGLELSRWSDNPLIENQQNKKDWSVSNRCVGFNVDIGIRNQNIFSSFQVSQDNGKATSESVNINLNMINQNSGRDVATQNVGLYNLYKNRSYQATVTCLGNALLQPTMYFNLRHVPMFNGAYLITDVNHTITPGQFQTQFTGIRQGFFDLPPIDSYLQSINKNMLTQLEKIVKSRKDQEPNAATTNNQKGNEKQDGPGNQPVLGESCAPMINVLYKNNYIPTTTTQTELTAEEFLSFISKQTTNKKLQAAIFGICYLSCFKDSFIGYNNNFANISLKNNYGNQLNELSAQSYICSQVETLEGKKDWPLATFYDPDYFIIFMRDRLSQRLDNIILRGLAKFYVCSWPEFTMSDSAYEKDIQKFSPIIETLRKGLNFLSNKLNVDFGNVEEFLLGTTPKKKTNINNIQPVDCNLPPIITDFTPAAGNKNTDVKIMGENLYDIISVSVNGIPANVKSVIRPTTIIINPPNTTGKIKIKTTHGEATSTTDFTFSQ